MQPDCRIVYIGERGGNFQDILAGNTDIDQTYRILAGKFRRYHGESWLKRLFDLGTNLKNLRDLVYAGLGIIQSLWLLRRIKPDVILLKGGYVGMPVGLAAAALRQNFVTHDSDALPGLANRLVSRWARWHATGMPAEFYNYPPDSVKHVGVLVAKEYQPVTPVLQKQSKIELGFPAGAQVLMVTGGSLGARAINLVMVKVAPKLLERFKQLHIVHQVGRANSQTYGQFSHPRLQVLEFLQQMHRFSAAADLIITRAGANTLAEFGVQGKACLVVPNPRLTGGHQLKNAEHLQSLQAIEVWEEDKLSLIDELVENISHLLQDSQRRRRLGDQLQSLTVSDAAHQLAVLLIDTAHAQKTKTN